MTENTTEPAERREVYTFNFEGGPRFNFLVREPTTDHPGTMRLESVEGAAELDDEPWKKME